MLSPHRRHREKVLICFYMHALHTGYSYTTYIGFDFASDSLRNQGLGVGRLQDDFVHDQYNSGSLGAPRPGGMRIDKSNLKNNNATSLIGSGVSTEGAEAFPFARKSTDKREQFTRSKAVEMSWAPNQSGWG